MWLHIQFHMYTWECDCTHWYVYPVGNETAYWYVQLGLWLHRPACPVGNVTAQTGMSSWQCDCTDRYVQLAMWLHRPVCPVWNVLHTSCLTAWLTGNFRPFIHVREWERGVARLHLQWVADGQLPRVGPLPAVRQGRTQERVMMCPQAIRWKGHKQPFRSNLVTHNVKSAQKMCMTAILEQGIDLHKKLKSGVE